MFGDHEWSLNPSRGLSAIAEFLVCKMLLTKVNTDENITSLMELITRHLIVVWSCYEGWTYPYVNKRLLVHGSNFNWISLQLPPITYMGAPGSCMRVWWKSMATELLANLFLFIVMFIILCLFFFTSVLHLKRFWKMFLQTGLCPSSHPT